eukprot:8510-Heterococcus_DN1.PRE.2
MNDRNTTAHTDPGASPSLTPAAVVISSSSSSSSITCLPRMYKVYKRSITVESYCKRCVRNTAASMYQRSFDTQRQSL